MFTFSKRIRRIGCLGTSFFFSQSAKFEIASANYSTLNLASQQEVSQLYDKGKEDMKQGNFYEAIETFHNSLFRVTDSSNENSLLVNQIYKNLGLAHKKVGNKAEAIKWLKMSLDAALIIYGNEHRIVASLYKELSQVYKTQEKYEEAILFLRRAIDTWVAIDLGTHPKVSKLYQELAELYDRLLQYDKASKSLLECLNVLKWYYEDSDHKIQEINLQLAICYQKSDKLELAKLYYIKVLRSTDNTDLIVPIFNNLAEVCKKLGQYSESISHYQKAIDFYHKTSDRKVENLFILYNNIGSLYHFLGKYEQAIQNYKSALSLINNISNISPASISGLYCNIGNIYFSLKSYDESLSYYKNAIDFVEDKNSPCLIRPYFNIGTAYIDREDSEKAMESLHKALIISVNVFGKKHQETIMILCRIGLIHGKQMNISKAESMIDESIRSLEEMKLKYSSELANCYYTQGLFYLEINDFNKAITSLKKALEIQVRLYGENHPDILATYKNVTYACLKKGSHYDAISYQVKVINCQMSIGTETDIKLGLEYGTLAIIYDEIGDFKKADENLNISTTFFNSR